MIEKNEIRDYTNAASTKVYGIYLGQNVGVGNGKTAGEIKGVEFKRIKNEVIKVE